MISNLYCESKQAIHVAKMKAKVEIDFNPLSAYAFWLTPLYDEGTKCGAALKHAWNHF